MKKMLLKPRFFVMMLSLIMVSLYITSCQTDEIASEEDAITETATSKSIPLDPDYIPPNIPNRFIDDHCVVRLAYLSYLERCPENAGVVSYWINVRRTQGFDALAAGFISSPEASQRWNSRYHQYLNRNNLTSYQVNKKVYIAYRGLLLREPDVNGGIYWTNILRNTNLRFVANAIASSPEFERRLARIATECANAANQCTY
ncbi:hypothetical protein [uncultured Kordia sp.]|uniref:hypothetical protein n=1 Tax=uncultured Kordia sp. TaxID=507699 RepID=UPI00261B37DE|nr:hypothetical protein [uncultured Kordia sp.]